MNGFINPGEWNFVMDMWDAERMTCCPISLYDLKRLRDAGVQTALEFVNWATIEPERGRYDWRIPDQIVMRLRAAGLKGMLLLPRALPKWTPDDWLAKSKDGNVSRYLDVFHCISPWNLEAQEYLNGFIRIACRRYKAPDMLCIQSQMFEGETLLPTVHAALFDSAALKSHADFVGDPTVEPDPANELTRKWMFESLKRVVLTQQRIYCEAHPSRTVSMQLHPLNSQFPACGNFGIMEYWQAIQEEIRPNQKLHILFTYFVPEWCAGNVEPFLAKCQDAGIRVIAGSEWPAGLNTNTPRALADGLSGLLTAPQHPYLGLKKVEDSAVEAFRNSRRMFNNRPHATAGPKKNYDHD